MIEMLGEQGMIEQFSCRSHIAPEVHDPRPLLAVVWKIDRVWGSICYSTFQIILLYWNCGAYHLYILLRYLLYQSWLQKYTSAYPRNAHCRVRFCTSNNSEVFSCDRSRPETTSWNTLKLFSRWTLRRIRIPIKRLWEDYWPDRFPFSWPKSSGLEGETTALWYLVICSVNGTLIPSSRFRWHIVLTTVVLTICSGQIPSCKTM